MTSQITSLMIVYSTVYSGIDQGKHQSSMSLAFVWGIHRWPVNSPHKGPVTRKMFPFDDAIMIVKLCICEIVDISTHVDFPSIHYQRRIVNHIEPWTKWLTFCRQYFEIHFVDCKVFSCDQAALQMVFSVCPSVCLSHLFDYVPIIVSSWNFQELLPMTKVRSMQKVKVRGQRSRSQRSQPNLTVSGL